MATTYIQRVIKLTPDQLANLEALAIQTNSRPKDGKLIYQPSWQYLLRRLGDNEFILTERVPYNPLPGLDEAIRVHEERQREQERVAEQQRRVSEHKRPANGKLPLKLEQLEMAL